MPEGPGAEFFLPVKALCPLCHLEVDVTTPHRYVDDCVAALDEQLADEDSHREESQEKDLERWDAAPAPNRRPRRRKT